MTPRYRFDAEQSRFTVQAFAAGLLSFIGHSPTFAIRDLAGTVAFEDDLIAKLRVELTVGAGSLRVLDDLQPSDRGEMEDRMRAEVLETGAFPQVEFRGAAADIERLDAGHYRLMLDGTLTLHGVTRPHRGEAELTMFADGLRLRGITGLRMSDFNIAPVTALGGTLRLKDDLKFIFDLAAIPEGA